MKVGYKIQSRQFSDYRFLPAIFDIIKTEIDKKAYGPNHQYQ
jgi:hypothetical protein